MEDLFWMIQKVWHGQIYNNSRYILLIFHMFPKGGRQNHTLSKPLEDSSMSHEESEDVFY